MEQSQNQKSTKESIVWYALSLAWQLGYTIAIPLVVLALAGRFADKKLGSAPWLLLAGIIMSLVISSLAISRKISFIMRSEQGIKNKELRIKRENREDSFRETPDS